MTRFAAFAPVFVLCAMLSAADEKPAVKELSPAGKEAAAAFEKVKSLAGTWKGTATCMGKTDPLTIVYKVTSGGHAVLETIAPGTDHEMLTVYHLDGEKLRLTHYCVLANQPTMLATKLEGDSIKFVFAGGADATCCHMSSAVFTFEGKDTLKATWTLSDKGKAMGDSKMEIHRQK